MKFQLLFVAAVSLFPASYNCFAQEKHLAKIDLVQTAPNSGFFRIESGEANVAGALIKRVEVTRDAAVVTYYNTYPTPKGPAYTFKIFNAYGLQIASFEDNWGFKEIAAGGLRKQEKSFTIYPLNDIFLYTSTPLSMDWDTPVYIKIGSMQP